MHTDAINASLDGNGPPLHVLRREYDHRDNLGVNPEESDALARATCLPSERVQPLADSLEEPA